MNAPQQTSIGLSPSLVLIDPPGIEWGPGLWLALLLIAAIAAVLMMMLKVALRSRREKVITGMAGMIGQRGRAETNIASEGTVFVRGELWRARSDAAIATGETVRVVGLDGLTLVVERDRDGAIAPPSRSAIDGQ